MGASTVLSEFSRQLKKQLDADNRSNDNLSTSLLAAVASAASDADDSGDRAHAEGDAVEGTWSSMAVLDALSKQLLDAQLLLSSSAHLKQTPPPNK